MATKKPKLPTIKMPKQKARTLTEKLLLRASSPEVKKSVAQLIKSQFTFK